MLNGRHDTQHILIQHNDTLHIGKLLCWVMQNVTMLIAFALSVVAPLNVSSHLREFFSETAGRSSPRRRRRLSSGPPRDVVCPLPPSQQGQGFVCLRTRLSGGSQGWTSQWIPQLAFLLAGEHYKKTLLTSLNRIYYWWYFCCSLLIKSKWNVEAGT